MREYLPVDDETRGPNVLELFARTSLAGPLPLEPASGGAAEFDGARRERGTWLSVGNEAIKFNVLDGTAPHQAAGWLRNKVVL